MPIGKISDEIASAQDYLFEDQTVPQNATTNGAGQLVGGTNGAIEVIAKVGDTDISLADTTSITVVLAGASTEGGSYSQVTELYSKIASGAETIPAGTELGRYIVNTKDPLWIKGSITTTDASATGTVTIFPAYPNR